VAKPKPKFEESENFCFTSMIDIVFLLLIFFILQPFKSPEMKLDNELPKDVGPSNTMEQRVTIRLVVRTHPTDKAAALYFINQTQLGPNFRRIATQLIQECSGDRETPVSLAADGNVYFEHVLKALDQCHVAEMRKVAFEAPPPPKP